MNPREDRFRLIIGEYDTKTKVDTLNQLENDYERVRIELKQLKASIEDVDAPASEAEYWRECYEAERKAREKSEVRIKELEAKLQ